MDDHAICSLRNNWFRMMTRMVMAFLLSIMLQWFVTRTIHSFTKETSQKGHNSSQQRVINLMYEVILRVPSQVIFSLKTLIPYLLISCDDHYHYHFRILIINNIDLCEWRPSWNVNNYLDTFELIMCYYRIWYVTVGCFTNKPNCQSNIWIIYWAHNDTQKKSYTHRYPLVKCFQLFSKAYT